jgi:hypothetical protein
VFEIVVAVAIQIVFRLEMHQNKFFYFLKIIFDISTSKRSENIKKTHFMKKKLNFERTRFAPHSQTLCNYVFCKAGIECSYKKKFN